MKTYRYTYRTIKNMASFSDTYVGNDDSILAEQELIAYLKTRVHEEFEIIGFKAIE